MEKRELGPQHVDTYQVQDYLYRAFPNSKSASEADTRRRNGHEIARFARFVLDKQINLLNFNKWRNSRKQIRQLPSDKYQLLQAFQRSADEVRSRVPKERQRALDELFRSKYKPALEMAIQTGCRPSEALYAANFKQLWTRKKKAMVLAVPPDLSKTGFEQRWTFDAGYSAALADRLYRRASDAVPCDEFSDPSPGRLRYIGLHDYFVRVQKVLKLEGYRD